MSKLKLNGKPFNLKPASPTETKLLHFLSRAPVDEIYTIPELSKKTGCARCSIERCEALAEFTTLLGPRRYWGNPKAIAELRRQAGA